MPVVVCARFLTAAGIVTGLVRAANPRLGVTFNLTASMPVGAYRLSRMPVGGLRRGDAVVACLPPRGAALARDRHYVVRGSCPGHLAPIGKRVAAVAGDVVVVADDGVLVNDLPMPHSRPLAADSHGRPLVSMAVGTYQVAPGEVWLLSPYSARSFDSRYFGPVTVDAVQGVIRMLSDTASLRLLARPPGEQPIDRPRRGPAPSDRPSSRR